MPSVDDDIICLWFNSNDHVELNVDKEGHVSWFGKFDGVYEKGEDLPIHIVMPKSFIKMIHRLYNLPELKMDHYYDDNANYEKEQVSRTPYDGKPYYCKTCGLGFNEWSACEEVNCVLESVADAAKRAKNDKLEN